MRGLESDQINKVDSVLTAVDLGEGRRSGRL